MAPDQKQAVAPSNPTTASANATADGNLATLDRKRQDGRHRPPAASPPPPRVITGPAEQVVPSYDEATAGSGSSGAIPTVDSPFTFPPSYEAGGGVKAESPSGDPCTQQKKPIAIPQVAPGPAAPAPFISAYPPSLLARGITEQAWRSFLETVSAFLTARISDRAVAHAGDVARSLGEPHASYARSLAGHAKSVDRQIARDARRFHLLGVAANVIAAAVSIPVHAALGAVHTVSAIPSTALAAVSKTPRTPLQRAATYSAVASRDWLNARGLHAVLLDTGQLADMVRVPADALLDIAAGGGKTGGAAGTMRALEGHLEKLSVSEEKAVVLGAQSLWLVLVPVVAEIDASR